MLITQAREPITCGVEGWRKHGACRPTRNTARHQIPSPRLSCVISGAFCEPRNSHRSVLFKDSLPEAA
jgi:hypothetical protein